MALPAKPFESDLVYLHLLPADREAAHVRHALAGVDVEALYRTARADVWQFETKNAPHIVRRALERLGMDVLAIEADDDTPDTLHYVRFAPEPYLIDTDWPAAPYYPRPADWPRVWPWERAPKVLRTDAVAGPAGVVLCDLDTTPAALIPVPGCPGLDYSYADMGMVDPEPVIDPEPPAPQPALTVTYGQRRLPAEIVRRDSGRVYARCNISTSERPLWYCIPIAQIVTKGEAA